MRYEIVLAPEAHEDFKAFNAKQRAEIKAAMEQFLRHFPGKTSKSRMKRLRGLSRPQYRLRIGDQIRVFYDISETTVEILAMIVQQAAIQWLKKHGESDEANSTD